MRSPNKLYSQILRNIITPLFDSAMGTPTRRYLKELERSQWSTPAMIEELQERKLRSLVRHAYETVPHYHQIFRDRGLKPDDIKSISDLRKLPVISRAEVREQFDSLVSDNYPKSRVICGRTGGSTGEPIRFYTTPENRGWSTAARYLAWKWAGFQLGDKFAQVFGSPIDQPAVKSLRDKFEGKVKRRISLNAFQVSEETLEKFVYTMRKFNPAMIYGYAAQVANVARFVEDKGLEGINPRSIVVDSMGLFENEVRLIERAFGCRVWWNYHNRENGTFASECAEHSGYHLFAQNHVFEFVRKGEPVAPGEIASLVVTDLTNYAMPFIRYEVGDMGVLSNEVCACGRGLPLMKKLFGRTSEILVSASGELVFDPFYGRLESYFENKKIEQYQIVQETPARVIVRIVPGKKYSSEDSDILRKMMRSVMGDMQMEVSLVESISDSGSGKRQVVVRKFPLTFT